MHKYLLILMLTCINITRAMAQQRPVPVSVSGLVDHPFSLDSAAAAGLSVQAHPGFQLMNDKGEVRKKIGSFKGILLADIIRKAGITMADHKDRGKYYIVVTATDKYQVIFGYDEVMFGSDASAAYLITEVDGQTLGKSEPFVMAVPGDRVGGPRYIKMVQSIDVRKI